MHMCDLHPRPIPFQSHRGPGLRTVPWRKEVALYPHVQPAVLSFLLQVWGPPLHVLEITWDSPNSRLPPIEPQHLPTCQSLSSYFWFPKKMALLLKVLWPIHVYFRV